VDIVGVVCGGGRSLFFFFFFLGGISVYFLSIDTELNRWCTTFYPGIWDFVDLQLVLS